MGEMRKAWLGAVGMCGLTLGGCGYSPKPDLGTPPPSSQIIAVGPNRQPGDVQIILNASLNPGRVLQISTPLPSMLGDQPARPVPDSTGYTETPGQAPKP